MRRLLPYGLAVGGVLAITAALVLVSSRVAVANLGLAYLLLVLWLGARYGKWPAVFASVLAILCYDVALVPPVGSLTVADAGQLGSLLALLAAALVTGQLAGAARRAQGEAQAMAAESRSLYELATTALRLPEVAAALELVRQRMLDVPSVREVALLGLEGDRLVRVTGPEPPEEARREADLAWRRRQPIGLMLDGERLRLLRPTGRQLNRCVLPMASGVLLLTVTDEEVPASGLRLLAALLSLAGLLLDRRRAGHEAERAASLAASDQLKAAILSSISHELKSPIASLRAGLTALLAPAAQLTRDQRELVEGLDRNASHLDHLVGDLLDMARLEAGGAVHPRPEALDDVVGGVLHRLRPELAAFALEVRVPVDLPPVPLDEQQLGRALTNLLENAREWTPPGRTITIGARAVDGAVELSVANDGPPITPGDLDRVFDKFWTRRKGGSGLGLAICKRVAEAHGGTVRAENLRRGPRFTLVLPLSPVGAPSRVPQATGEPDGDGRVLGGIRLG